MIVQNKASRYADGLAKKKKKQKTKKSPKNLRFF
jgi:hypothetical protein